MKNDLWECTGQFGALVLTRGRIVFTDPGSIMVNALAKLSIMEAVPQQHMLLNGESNIQNS